MAVIANAAATMNGCAIRVSTTGLTGPRLRSTSANDRPWTSPKQSAIVASPRRTRALTGRKYPDAEPVQVRHQPIDDDRHRDRREHEGAQHG